MDEHLKPAIIANDGTVSRAALDETTARLAAGLLAGAPNRDDVHGLDGARVAFLVPPSVAYVASLRGIWQAGGVAVPLATSHPPAELDYVIRDAGASIVIAGDAGREILEPLARRAGARFASADALLHAPAGHTVDAARPDRRALMLYTSGTTGRPKGVVTTHANLAAQVASLVTAWEWTPHDRALLVLPLHHVHGIINVLCCALASGATVEIASPFDAERTWQRLASGEISVFTAVPTIYHRLIQSWDAAPLEDKRARAEGCRDVRLMMSGSAALPISVLERWRAITGHTLLERYGMTELGMALSNPLHGERRPGAVGVPLPGVEVRLVDEHGHNVQAGAPGELEVRGPAVFLEYWGRAEETRQAFRDGWFRTGDVAVLEHGSYRLLGRTSVDIIKTGGFKISALEIEEVVREHPSVADCAIVGIADAEWGERVCAAVELRPNAVLSLRELQAWTKARLAPYKVPKNLKCVAALPRNAMGKVVKPEVVSLLSLPARR